MSATQKKSLGILFFSGPYQSEAPETVCKIANAALDKGYKVQIFCYMDAANSVICEQKKVEGIFNIEEHMREIAEKGAIIRVCNLCLQVRGTAKSLIKIEEIKTGGMIKRAGTPDLAKIIDETDRFLVVT